MKLGQVSHRGETGIRIPRLPYQSNTCPMLALYVKLGTLKGRRSSSRAPSHPNDKINTGLFDFSVIQFKGEL